MQEQFSQLKPFEMEDEGGLWVSVPQFDGANAVEVLETPLERRVPVISHFFDFYPCSSGQTRYFASRGYESGMIHNLFLQRLDKRRARLIYELVDRDDAVFHRECLSPDAGASPSKSPLALFSRIQSIFRKTANWNPEEPEIAKLNVPYTPGEISDNASDYYGRYKGQPINIEHSMTFSFAGGNVSGTYRIKTDATENIFEALDALTLSMQALSKWEISDFIEHGLNLSQPVDADEIEALRMRGKVYFTTGRVAFDKPQSPQNAPQSRRPRGYANGKAVEPVAAVAAST